MLAAIPKHLFPPNSHSDNKCVFGYIRTDGKQTLLALFNFSDKEATIAPKLDGNVTMLLNTDWEAFGGHTAKSRKKTIINGSLLCFIFYIIFFIPM